MRTKKQVLIFASALMMFFGLTGAQSAFAATFPIDKAGIGAYVKLNSYTIDDYNRAKETYFNTLDSIEVYDTYVIGQKKFSLDGSDSAPSMRSYYIYLSNDGWLVAYLWKEEYGRFSQIINWKDGAPLDNTMLKVAIDDAAGKIGVAYTAPVKYYDFSHPAANKMTIIRESVDSAGGDSNDFTIYVPGTIHSASYALNLADCPTNSTVTVACSNPMFREHNSSSALFHFFTYHSTNYSHSLISGNQSYKITISRDDSACRAILGSLIIYETD